MCCCTNCLLAAILVIKAQPPKVKTRSGEARPHNLPAPLCLMHHARPRSTLDARKDEASLRTAGTRALESNLRNAVSQLADLIHAVQYSADTVM